MDLTRDRVDAFTLALDPIDTRPEIMCTSTFNAPFSLAFNEPAAHLHLIESGTFQVLAESASAYDVSAGDIVLIRPNENYVLTSDCELPPTPIAQALDGGLSADGRHLTFGGATTGAQVLCARFRIDGGTAAQLIGALPEVIVVNHERNPAQRWLREIVNQLHREVRDQPLGSQIIATRLLHILFVDLIRVWAQRAEHHLSRIEHASDPLIARSLAAIHTEPARAWTVNQLAAHAGISRSVFAQRFTTAVGESPQRYITSTRLQRAFTALRAQGESVREIATRAGYGSEAAFSRAFKRRFGATASAIRKGQLPPALTAPPR